MTTINYFGNNIDFYPTPASLLRKMTDGLKLAECPSILEPSAGKGDIVDALFEKNKVQNMGWDRHEIEVDTIEIDPNLQHILRGKKFSVVHDDFLTFETAKRYELIIMNPPFSSGEYHLLKALDLQKAGGKVVCLLNAETIRNPFSNPRKILIQKLQEYGAEIQFFSDAFSDAERPTGVDVALIKVSIPVQQRESLFFSEERLKCEEIYRAKEARGELVNSGWIESKVEHYKYEVHAGVRLIEEYFALLPHMLDSLKSKYAGTILELKISDHRADNVNEAINGYVKKVRLKYWENLFSDDRLTSRCTSNLQNDLRSRINDMARFDFSLYNIEQIKAELIHGLIKGVEDTIITLFDDLSNRHSYSDYSKNIHYYNGWKTNKSWIINKRVIIPMYNAFSEWSGKPQFVSYCFSKLFDIEKVLNYLDQGETSDSFDLRQTLQRAENSGITRNIETKYFRVSFYKKNTCHLEFKNLDLLKKFNIYGSQRKGWLPPTYGKKAYDAMADEEKAVVDEFEGAAEYQRTLQRKDYFLAEPGPRLLQIA